MKKHLVLVDYENVPKIDMSGLDESHRAIVFVGAGQNAPRAARQTATAHRFRRVDFQQVAGSGKNALDFHIAFQLGRTFETAPETVCIVVSRDKGFDPLLMHLNENGLVCRRVTGFAELATAPAEPELVVCRRCGKSQTIELYGGRWCSNCGRYASPPDPTLLPSNQLGYCELAAGSGRETDGPKDICGWCHQPSDMSEGICDDGEWMCGACIAEYAR